MKQCKWCRQNFPEDVSHERYCLENHDNTWIDKRIEQRRTTPERTIIKHVVFGRIEMQEPWTKSYSWSGYYVGDFAMCQVLDGPRAGQKVMIMRDGSGL